MGTQSLDVHQVGGGSDLFCRRTDRVAPGPAKPHLLSKTQPDASLGWSLTVAYILDS